LSPLRAATSPISITDWAMIGSTLGDPRIDTLTEARSCGRFKFTHLDPSFRRFAISVGS
jgi:hypothetical protein